MEPLVFFFDRNTGRGLPEGLAKLKPDLPLKIRSYRSTGFAKDMPDDEWMAELSTKDWILIGHDKRWHQYPMEAAAIKAFGLRCFYLPGGQATRWKKGETFFRFHRKMIDIASTNSGPFIYAISPQGRFKRIAL